ncbi:hypothetical protein [Daejeonella sp.]|uniref:hypothetical protein n=1 Tax=Daejeonella sp. TaxID=2805397 RepID=UPI002723C6FE|nr:hypothetical protein [Daejeonella sp.]MDO8992779.1 hypothetical protein [Daejeonella sp.]MDP2412452.1 hypothetical protein [Daejeonella sp.]
MILYTIKLTKAHISTLKEVKQEVETWQKNLNNKNSKINGQFTNKEARVKLKRLYLSIHWPGYRDEDWWWLW